MQKLARRNAVHSYRRSQLPNESNAPAVGNSVVRNPEEVQTSGSLFADAFAKRFFGSGAIAKSISSNEM